jgi:L-threonylcarbamoyladenylate synthase
MTAEVVRVDEIGLEESIRLMQESLNEAGVVIFPTETVYGLAARADMLGAVSRLFEIKNRPSSTAIPVMVKEKEKVYDLTIGADERFERLAEYFWPGPLTMVLSKNMVIDTLVTGGRRSVAIRIPSHEVPLGLLRTMNVPIAVTSANISGEEPMT